MILPIQILTETPPERWWFVAVTVITIAAIAIRLVARRAARRRVAKRAPWKSAVYNPKEFRCPR